MAAPDDLSARTKPPESEPAGQGTSPAKERRRRWWRSRKPPRQRDLNAERYPFATPDDWRDPNQAFTTLYRHAEGKAIETMNWYLRDKRGKKRWSRALRALAIALAAGGGVLPLLSAARPGMGGASWGYVLLALAAACIGFDRFFGLSSGWMRDVTTAQTIQRRLERFQLDWAVECARAASGPIGSMQVLNRFELLRAFGEDLLDFVRHETAEWVVEFQSSLAQLELSGQDARHAYHSQVGSGSGITDRQPGTPVPPSAQSIRLDSPAEPPLDGS